MAVIDSATPLRRRSWTGLPAAFDTRVPPDYPMISPNYAKKRKEIAQATGLGKRDGDDRARIVRGNRHTDPRSLNSSRRDAASLVAAVSAFESCSSVRIGEPDPDGLAI